MGVPLLQYGTCAKNLILARQTLWAHFLCAELDILNYPRPSLLPEQN